MNNKIDRAQFETENFLFQIRCSSTAHQIALPHQYSCGKSARAKTADAVPQRPNGERTHTHTHTQTSFDSKPCNAGLRFRLSVGVLGYERSLIRIIIPAGCVVRVRRLFGKYSTKRSTMMNPCVIPEPKEDDVGDGRWMSMVSFGGFLGFGRLGWLFRCC